MHNNRLYPADRSHETSSYNADDIYDNNWAYPSPYFQFVPSNILFDEMEHDLRADAPQYIISYTIS